LAGKGPVFGGLALGCLAISDLEFAIFAGFARKTVKTSKNVTY
jgi:hypothetical protein